MKKHKKILHIDIENGYGGSSRSLSLLVKYIDNDKFISDNKKGPALKRNRDAGKKCEILYIGFLIFTKK